VAQRYDIQVAAEARRNLDDMAEIDADRVEDEFERALSELGREHKFRVVVHRGEPTRWLTFAVKPYTVIFGFLERADGTEVTVVAAVPHQDELDRVKSRLIEESAPDDWDWE
jgi:hypothetical protein